MARRLLWEGMATVVAITRTSVVASCRPQTIVSFPTSDGGVVFAVQRGTGDHGIVLAHGGRFTKGSWQVQAESLSARGFLTLALDFRGRGRSRGGPGMERDDDAAHLDVLAAVEYLRNQGVARMGLRAKGADHSRGIGSRAAGLCNGPKATGDD